MSYLTFIFLPRQELCVLFKASTSAEKSFKINVQSTELFVSFWKNLKKHVVTDVPCKEEVQNSTHTTVLILLSHLLQL
jgi:hypothetical protein